MLRNKSLRSSGQAVGYLVEATYNSDGTQSIAIDTASAIANDVKGLADGSLTSFSAPQWGVTSLVMYRFNQFTSLTSLDLTGVTDIPEYTANGCTGLTSLTLDPNTTNIGQFAFYNCSNCRPELTFNNTSIGQYAFSNIRVKKLQGSLGNINNNAFTTMCNSSNHTELVNIKINGYVKNGAFNNNMYVDNFVLDPTSNITLLEQNSFALFGTNRSNPENNPFTFDFRNSTFTIIPSYCFYGDSAYHNMYYTIYFPATVSGISTYAFSNCDYLTLYFKTIPTLSNTNAFGSYSHNKIFFPYNLAQTAKTSTNWTSIASSIYGYSDANEFSFGDTLPVADDNGYGLTWYSDEAMTTQVTTVSDPTQMYYCSVGARAYVKLSATTINSTLTVSDGVNTYTSGDFVAVGTVLTISAVGASGYPDPYIFTVNGTTISSGDTYTVTSSDIMIVSVYYDGVNPPFDPVFANNTWAQIENASLQIAGANMTSNEVYATYGWSIGDIKSETLSTNEVIQLQIIGFNHDTLSSDHTTKAGITLQMVNCLATRYPMNSTNTNAGGWNACEMRTTTLPTIKALLSSDLQAVIKTVDKKAANGGSNNYTATVTSEDQLFLLAEKEIFGSVHNAQDGNNEGTQYEYWTSHNTNSARIKYYDNAGTSTKTPWWERSSSDFFTSMFCYVYSDGTADRNNSSYNRGVSFALCV